MFEKLGYILVAITLSVFIFGIGIESQPQEEILEPTETTYEDLNIQESLDLVKNRIIADQLENGQFHYIYYPSTDEYAESYNIIRHTLGAYALLEFGETEKAKKSIDFILENLIEEDEMSYITYNERTKLGTAAVTVLTLLKYQDLTDSTEYNETIKELGEFILFMQDEDGGYRNYHPEANPESRLATVLYTGESNLALIRMYQEYRDERYLEAAEKSYDWCVTYFEERHSTGLVSWNSSAFAETYYETGDLKYAAFALQMNEWLIETTQYTDKNAPSQDYIGAFYVSDVEEGITCSAAAYGEGFGDMLALAKNLGDQEKIDKYESTLRSTIKFLQSMQFTDPENEKTYGGFKASMYNNQTRIDYNTHAALTLQKSLENGLQ